MESESKSNEVAPASRSQAPEVALGDQTLVVNRNDLEFSEEEKQRIEQALAKSQGKNRLFVVTGERGLTRSIGADDLHDEAAIFFKGCHEGTYTITAPTVKVLVEQCTNFKLHINATVKTETLELWNCEEAHLHINVPIMTLQADISKKLSMTYKDKDVFGSLVWSGIYGLALRVGDDTHESGYEQMKEQYPDINDQSDQFIVRYVNGALLSEQVVRLPNGFPTTEREAKEYDDRQKAAEEIKEAYLRNLVQWAAPKLGLKDDRKRPKIGRNDPCPCKSGKKFKSCCWNKYEN